MKQNAGYIVMHNLSNIVLKFVICAFSVCITLANAQAVFMCTGDDGVVEYTNSKNKNCKELKLQKLNIIPSSNYPKSLGSASTKIDNAPLPSFPNVTQNVQQQRDNDRKSILGKELDIEAKKLQDLQKEYNGGMPERRGDEKNYQKYLDRLEQLKKDMSRTQGNIESLRKEMGLK